MKTLWSLGLFLLVTAGICSAAEPADPSRDILYQTSLINALLAGHFDGTLSCGELLRHGDFGLGTFEGIDGEMVILDRTVYQIRHDGSVHIVEPAILTPFANVTWFEADLSLDMQLPKHGFGRLDLSGDRTAELNAVEK